MPIHRSDRERRRRAFLTALRAGRTVTEAAERAGIPSSTLYLWRETASGFRAAWDRAAETAEDALLDRMQTALIERAVEGTDEPVFHNGHYIGTRKRYSDALLLAGLRHLTGGYGAPSKPYTITVPEKPAITVRTFAAESETTGVAAALTASEPPAPSTSDVGEPVTLDAAPVAPSPPLPDPDKPLCWAHLGRNDQAARRA